MLSIDILKKRKKDLEIELVSLKELIREAKELLASKEETAIYIEKALQEIESGIMILENGGKNVVCENKKTKRKSGNS